ncbi:MAG: hypothetical protein LBE61_09505 [Burkholderiaceae bacterium]|jgi:DNA-directed RNA polymerase subunit RPC12/RpoP|nr:hypothetical protein [Burkholderiaceae bacterium]
MWKCVSCGLLVMFKAANPEIDEKGFYFECPGCGQRNELINVGKGEFTELAQPIEK